MQTPVPPKLDRGPSWAIKWANAVLDYMVRTHITEVTIANSDPTQPDAKSESTETPHGTRLRIRAGASDGTGGGGSGSTKSLYFIEGGVLKKGDFTVKNVTLG